MIVKILDRVFIGDSDYVDKDLEDCGINYVINVGGHKTNLEDRWIHLSDDGYNDFQNILDAVNLLTTKVYFGNRVLVHCRAGLSRSPFIVSKFLERFGYSKFDAVEFIKTRHPATQINIDLLNSEMHGK